MSSGKQFSLSIDDTLIKGKVFIPGSDNSETGIIICHGIPGTDSVKSQKKAGYDSLGRYFSQKGFLTVTFNFRGTGESGGNLDLAGWVEDLKEVIRYYFESHGSSYPRLVLTGFSAGAAVSLEVAVDDKRIEAIALGACPLNFDFFTDKFTGDQVWRWFSEAGLFRDPDIMCPREEWFKRFRSIRPEEKIGDISARHLLIMHGVEDDLIPVYHAMQLYSLAGGKKRMTVFPGVSHRMRNYRRVIHYLYVWLKEIT